MSGGTAMMGQAASNDLNRRRIRRYTIAVPIDVVALRSGVPASIPGRTVNVSEGGVATVLAGELSPGESVGVEFFLPLARAPIQAKAVVRHYSLMQCGLQFLAMPPEQESILRAWTQVADRTSVVSTPNAVSRAAMEARTIPIPAIVKPVKRSHGLRWALISAGIAVLVLAAIAWWTWSSGWRELEGENGANPTGELAVDVSSSAMEQRIIHRVDPIYPSDALQAKIQGEVTLEALIADDGTVRDVYAMTGPEPLRAAAVNAVKWWRFEPYEINGKRTPVHTLIAVDFRLDR